MKFHLNAVELCLFLPEQLWIDLCEHLGSPSASPTYEISNLLASPTFRRRFPSMRFR